MMSEEKEMALVSFSLSRDD
uniref:Uncharacterized protein n=1 Tax=Amphimedon queenslandica TaxID=400682 RepID=A0A1X7VWE3_AMPQE